MYSYMYKSTKILSFFAFMNFVVVEDVMVSHVIIVTQNHLDFETLGDPFERK